MAKKESHRGNWKNWFEFMFSCIGCMVGLGNIWRFPYVCYKNGGGAFLVPYFIFMLLCALPLIFIELTYSQYSNLGPGKVWICCPLFKGIGFAMITLTCIVSLYYNVILAWTLYYLGMSFFPSVPWGSCDNDWNTPACYTRGGGTTDRTPINSTNSPLAVNVTKMVVHELYSLNKSSTSLPLSLVSKTSTEEFWEHKVLKISDGIDSPGAVRWELLICLFIAWLIVFLCLIKGIKTSGKVVYVAATVPYLFLIILLIRGLMLPGAVDGLKYYLIPRWEDLLKFSVWGDAAVQMFYSAGLGWGGIATLASYNNFNNNCYRDAMILPVLDVMTSWFAGMVIFVTLGFMAKEANVDIGVVVKDGPGIAFMVYPEALSRMPLPQLWSVLFFLMLFTVGLDSQMVHVQTLTGALTDNFPHFLRNKRMLMTGSLCFTGFLLGIPCITQGGIYVLTLIDWYCASISVMFLAFLEISVLAWVYGGDRLYKDLEMMLGYKPITLWKIMWKFVAPVIILFVWLWSIVRLKPVKYGDYMYPVGTLVIGWLIALMSLVPIPVGMVHTICSIQGSISKRMRMSILPTPAWKPAIPDLVDEHEAMKGLDKTAI